MCVCVCVVSQEEERESSVAVEYYVNYQVRSDLLQKLDKTFSLHVFVHPRKPWPEVLIEHVCIVLRQ